MMPPIVDVIAVSEDKLFYVTDKFLGGKKSTMRVMFAARKSNSFILISPMGSCHAMTVINLTMSPLILQAHPLQS